MSTIDDLHAPNAFIYSAAKVLGIRMRFQKCAAKHDLTASIFNVTAEYRFLKKANFRNDGRLIAGSYCDYYFFANADADAQMLETWLYFHSPRFPANYPAHIKCSYKFIGRPESRVEIIFEELHIPRQLQDCNLDKLTVFDSESANMNAVIDVLCDALPARRIISSGPDLLIEFNASSNVTAKGFRGKFRFPQNMQAVQALDIGSGNAAAAIVAIDPAAAPTTSKNVTTKELKIVASERVSLKKPTAALMNLAESKRIYQNNENCKYIFNSRNNKSGIFDSSSLFTADIPNVNIIPVSNIFPGRVQCRYEFQGEPFERIQIKFVEFNIPTEKQNSSNCNAAESLQLLAEVHGKHEIVELYCGGYFPKPLMSINNKLHLQFMGKYPLFGARSSNYGFKGEYTFSKDFGIKTGVQHNNDCTFSYNSTTRRSGWFASPNFPGFYPQNLICNYFFYGEVEERVLIRFTYFDVEGIGTCDFLTASDYVEFSNFLSTDRKFSKYCGKRHVFEIRSDGKFFRVTFYSNDRFEKTGFRALYDFESKYTSRENTSVQSFVSNNAQRIHLDFSTLFYVQAVLFFYSIFM